ncbi:uncharacterized protein JCM6883_002966 [Sporobolomyces salmoneus]|uniref:uncharacterized protein n=1 Tax=Sporobolomyces salmoneus TaxID=183962 RepID=UPI003181610B
MSRFNPFKAKDRKGEPAENVLQRRPSHSSLVEPTTTSSTVYSTDPVLESFGHEAEYLVLRSLNFSTQELDARFVRLLDAIPIPPKNHEGWKSECIEHWNKLRPNGLENDKAFYLQRLKRVFDLKVPVKAEGEFNSKVYDPAQIFKPRSEYINGDVSFALSRIAKALNRISQRDGETYQRWRERLRNMLKAWLTSGWYDEEHSFALKCEVEYRYKMISKGYSVIENGKVSKYHEVETIEKHLKRWKFPADVGARMREIEEWRRANRDRLEAAIKSRGVVDQAQS